MLSRLATSLGRRDEAPNQELATKIAGSGEAEAVKELVDNLSNKDKNIQSDCIKVLYEIGARDPRLIAAHCKEFGRLLTNKNNRLVWGGMSALDSIAAVDPKSIYSMLQEIVKAAGVGSVITHDHAVGILVKLVSIKEYAGACLPILLEQLKKCPDNQFPMYAEMSLQVASQSAKRELAKAIGVRLSGLRKESQRRRVEKALGRLT